VPSTAWKAFVTGLADGHDHATGWTFKITLPSGYSFNRAATPATKIGVSLRLWKADGDLKTGELETRSVTVRLKRAAKVTVNAAPEPVAKGKKITVTGKLTRANWETKKYGGYGGRTVELQFRQTGAAPAL
jgi:hypothetical protein